MNNFCAFILTHGRPDKVYTYDTLKKHGYTGIVYLIIDNEDKKAEQYYKKYPGQVLMFHKADIAHRIDEGDNFGDRRAIIYARNACFELAKQVGVRYFVELDDDYVDFRFKKNSKKQDISKKDIKNLNTVFSSILKFMIDSKSKSVAMAQGGDFMGGVNGNAVKNPQYRKCMNSFFCDTENRFEFFGRINEDVNTYIADGMRGGLFLTVPFVALQQKQTQANSGGMSELYLDSGTYIKSFYTVMYAPSCTKISLMQSRHPRLHHKIYWDNAVPKIIQERYKL